MVNDEKTVLLVNSTSAERKYAYRIQDYAGNYLITQKDKIKILGYIFSNEKFRWPTAILFLAPAEGWKGPSGPAENLWPHLK